jgi:hypothetical protein
MRHLIMLRRSINGLAKILKGRLTDRRGAIFCAPPAIFVLRRVPPGLLAAKMDG